MSSEPAIQNRRSTSIGLGVIADDLTGAMDTGVQFAREGLYTVVMLGGGEPPSARVVVVSTDSRDVAAAEAYRRVAEVARLLRDRLVYKKIDSTLRGNLGPELDGALEGLGLERALVAPAFPSMGRTTVDGCHMVHGVPLAESSFASDPVWPATESHLPTLLARQTRRPVGHLPLSVVERGAEAVRRALREESASIVVADAEDWPHLAALATALLGMEERWLPCGSAGLAQEWGRAIGSSGREDIPRPRPLLHEMWGWEPLRAPALVVAGSRHPATAAQLLHAAREGRLELVHLSADGEPAADPMDLLRRGMNVALATTFSPLREGMGAAAAAGLARAAVRLLEGTSVAGLLATGGDVARALCLELGAAAVRPLGEVQPGVVAGVLVGGSHDGLRVVTKAGGFGDETAILSGIDTLRGAAR